VMQRYARPSQPAVATRANQQAAGARTKLSTRDLYAAPAPGSR